MASIPPQNANPYQAPAERALHPHEPQFSFLPVVVGWGVDFGGTMVASFVLGIVLAVQAFSQTPRIKPEDLTRLFVNQPTSFWIVGIGVGLFFTMAGGFVTAWMARHFIWKHVFVMSLCSFVTALLTIGMNMAYGVEFAWFHVAGAAAAIPAALFGGWVRMATRRRSV